MPYARNTRFFAAPLALAVASVLAAGDARTEPSPAYPPAPPVPAAPATAPGAPAPPLASPVPAASEPVDHAPDLDAAVLAITHESLFKDAAIGIAILDIDSGHFLAAYHEHDAFNPASNAKLLTAAAALSKLHGNHRYETTLTGKVNGTNVGALTLHGFGDPSLRDSDLWAMAQELRARGIRKVDGDILVDQRFFDDQTTPPAFEQQPHEWAAFRAPVSAVAIDENTVTMTVRPTTAGNPAIVTFDPPGFVDVEGTVKSVEGGGADTVGLALSANGKRMTAKVSGSIAIESRLARFTRRVEDPQLLAGYALKAVLADAHIETSGDVKEGPGTGGVVLSRHESEPLSTLLYELGKASDNFYAEMVFKTLAGERARPARSAESSAAVTKLLADVGAMEPGVVVKNGSGLFDSNRVTPAAMVKLLRACWRDPAVREEYVAQLAIGGVDGTLRGRFHREKSRRAVRAKTGTLDDAIALSGYVLAPSGKSPVAFSIFFNKVEGKAHGARAAADKLVGLVSRRLWGASGPTGAAAGPEADGPSPDEDR